MLFITEQFKFGSIYVYHGSLWRPNIIIVVCYFSMNDVPTFLYISINSLILPMISILMLAFYSQFRQSFVRFINKSDCAGRVTKASIAMPVKNCAIFSTQFEHEKSKCQQQKH